MSVKHPEPDMGGQPVSPHEKRLLEDLARGKSYAFLDLYNGYHARLYYYILRFVKIPAVAEDILQDIFLKIWEIRERVDPELSFRSYLFTITRNRVFKFLKKSAADENIKLQILFELEKNITCPDLQLQWKEYETIFIHAVDQLPPQRQKVFRLCRDQGKTYDQAAAELGISRNTVKEHMVMAMKFVKEHLRHFDKSLGFIILLLFK